jgi:hypothetical protein
MPTIYSRQENPLCPVVTVNTGEVGDLVYFSDDDTVSKAAADCGNVAGVLAYKNTKTNEGTLESFFHHELEVECSGAIAAGDWIKVAAPNASGDQTFAKWTAGTDADHLRCGMCKVGGADTAKGVFLV